MSHFSVLAHVSTNDTLEDIMAPYDEQTEDPAFIAFEDKTEEVKKEWDSGTTTAVKLPTGKIVFSFDREVKNYKPEEVKTLENYPMSKMYANIKEFAKDYHGYRVCGTKFGYYHNPNAFYDYYIEGSCGRFGAPFLVKTSEPADSDAPEGYKWVSSAVKKDICWDKMLEITQEAEKERYDMYKKVLDGIIPINAMGPFTRIANDALYEWTDVVMKKNDTLEEFFARHNCATGTLYSIGCYGMVDVNGYHSRGQMGWFGMSSDDKSTDIWFNEIQDFLDKVPEEDILIMLDCHI